MRDWWRWLKAKDDGYSPNWLWVWLMSIGPQMALMVLVVAIRDALR